MSDLRCRQLKAGASLIECKWMGSPKPNGWLVFVWDASGELLVEMTASELSLEFEMPFFMFEEHFTVQVEQCTTPLILYGESLYID